MEPKVISGGAHSDDRGTLLFNNSFDASAIKRVYLIENKSTTIIRAWQGHRIEQRWFSAVQGRFEICLIRIDNWENPSKELDSVNFVLSATDMDVLHIPAGFVSSIQALTEGSKLLVMADYTLGEIQDEYRWDWAYFDN